MVNKSGLVASLVRRFTRYMLSVEDNVGRFVLLAMTVVFFVQVILRYTFMPLMWVEEVTVYLMMACCFVGVSIGGRWNNHVEVNFWLPLAGSRPYLYKITRAVAAAVTSVICFILGYWQAYHAVQSFTTYHMVSAVLQMPVAIPQAFIAYGLVAMGIYFLLRALRMAIELRRVGRQRQDQS